jgi:hypothetical protein
MLDLGKCLPIESFAGALAQHGSALTPHDPTAESFSHLADLQKKLSAVQISFIEQIKQLVMAQFDPIIQNCKEFPVTFIFSLTT